MKRPTLNLGPALRILRKRLGLTQAEAVERIEHRTGVALATQALSRWERSLAVPSLSALSAFLSGLGYTLWDLCNLLEGIDEETLLDKLRRSTSTVADAPAATDPAPDSVLPTRVGPVATQVLRTLEERIAAIERALERLARPRGEDPDRS